VILPHNEVRTMAIVIYHKGDEVILKHGTHSVPATVILASPNGRSLGLRFEAIFCDHVGIMALLQEHDGTFRALMTNHVVEVALAHRSSPSGEDLPTG
jgi:hypothetical protein